VDVQEKVPWGVGVPLPVIVKVAPAGNPEYVIVILLLLPGSLGSK
jgi:hypothetical protein